MCPGRPVTYLFFPSLLYLLYMSFIFKDYKNWCCYFPVTKINHSNNKNLKQKGFVLVHSLGVQFITERMSWQQNLEAADHVAFIVRTLRDEYLCLAHIVFCILLMIPAQIIVLPTVGILPVSINLILITPNRHAQRPFYPVILGLKLGIKISHQL